MRARRSVWSTEEIALLKHVVSLYEYRRVNYVVVSQLFENRTVLDIKKRCQVLRDRERRRARWRSQRAPRPRPKPEQPYPEQPCPEPPRPEPPRFEYGEKLHPALVWRAPDWHDLDPPLL
jgi:hypothetical protein